MTQSIVGMDVSKHSLDVVLLHPEQKHYQVVKNNLAGFEYLSSWLQAKGCEQVHICLEATG